MSLQKLIDKFPVELARINFRRFALPPIRLFGAVMKTNAAELAIIAENKSTLFLK